MRYEFIRALVRSAMNVSISCRLVSRPTLTLSAFTATFSGTPDASRTADGLGGEGWEGRGGVVRGEGGRGGGGVGGERRGGERRGWEGRGRGGRGEEGW